MLLTFSALVGFETKNKFTVKNSMGQKVFYAVEQSDCCTRNCCGPMRPFGMKILDNYKNEVIHLERPLACDSCWFPCCLQVNFLNSFSTFCPAKSHKSSTLQLLPYLQTRYEINTLRICFTIQKYKKNNIYQLKLK